MGNHRPARAPRTMGGRDVNKPITWTDLLVVFATLALFAALFVFGAWYQ